MVDNQKIREKEKVKNEETWRIYEEIFVDIPRHA